MANSVKALAAAIEIKNPKTGWTTASLTAGIHNGLFTLCRQTNTAGDEYVDVNDVDSVVIDIAVESGLSNFYIPVNQFILKFEDSTNDYEYSYMKDFAAQHAANLPSTFYWRVKNIITKDGTIYKYGDTKTKSILALNFVELKVAGA